MENLYLGLAVASSIFAAYQMMRFRKIAPEYKSLNEALLAKKSEIDSLSKKITEVNAQKGEAFAGLNSLTQSVKDKSDEESRLSARIAQLERDVNSLKESEQKAKSDYIDASSSLKVKQAELVKAQEELLQERANLSRVSEQVSAGENRLQKLVELESREQTILSDIKALEKELSDKARAAAASEQELLAKSQTLLAQAASAQTTLSQLMGKLDLYSRIDEYTCVGHFDIPEYLFQTSIRYQEEIKMVREAQRELISKKEAVTLPSTMGLFTDPATAKRAFEGQANLMLSAFNIECDFLIGKVNPSSLGKTLEQIEKKAEQLEKSCASLRCGFNLEYVRLKYEECKLQFEFVRKKQEEQEEQRLIREQMREEAKIQKQYEDAVKDAEREELKFHKLIERARQQLEKESEGEKALTLAKISLLEEQLKEAEERGIRAKSMAEQTRRGFVYVISNIGAFGEGVYKIGLTRRLDPQERVDELGDASVPFPFDVHAMCYSEDAPALEKDLHRRFASRRVNAVNFRKEFFKVSLEEIREAVCELAGKDVDFQFTAKAEDYFESRRLLAA